MVGVLIIPTGIGCEIGGHAGDANSTAKLIASVCSELIVHPNVVNASDINEMPDNCLYVEGSMLDRFLEGKIGLRRPIRYNRILLTVNSPLRNDTVNAVNAARTTIGAEIEIVVLDTPLIMVAQIGEEGATGEVQGWEALVEQVSQYSFDALAIASPIEINKQAALDYLTQEQCRINPWGGVEAKASKLIANKINKPIAHAPTENADLKNFKEVVDPRLAAEMLSSTFLHSVFKGLHKAPHPTEFTDSWGMTIEHISFLLTPVNCFGRPHRACMEAGVPIIAIRENTCCLSDHMPDSFIQVDNYLEAVGVIVAMRAGVSVESIRRPLGSVNIK